MQLRIFPIPPSKKKDMKFDKCRDFFSFSRMDASESKYQSYFNRRLRTNSIDKCYKNLNFLRLSLPIVLIIVLYFAPKGAPTSRNTALEYDSSIKRTGECTAFNHEFSYLLELCIVKEMLDAYAYKLQYATSHCCIVLYKYT